MAAHIEKTYRSSDGLTLFYRDFENAGAAAAPVLCLPGLTRNSRDFLDLAERVSATRRVLCPDLRGRGFSDWDRDHGDYRPPVYVGDVLKLLDAEGVDRAVVIGTSLGGLMAMSIAAMRPEILAGVVINDIGPELAPEGVTRILSYAGRQTPVATWAEATAQAKETFGAGLPGLSEDEWGAFARRGYREDDNGVVRLDYDPQIGAAAREAGAAAQVDAWALFAALKPVPTLALRGAASDLLSEATFDRMAQEKPDLLRVTIPNRGHAPMLNEAEALEAIDGFLSRIP